MTSESHINEIKSQYEMNRLVIKQHKKSLLQYNYRPKGHIAHLIHLDSAKVVQSHKVKH